MPAAASRSGYSIRGRIARGRSPRKVSRNARSCGSGGGARIANKTASADPSSNGRTFAGSSTGVTTFGSKAVQRINRVVGRIDRHVHDRSASFVGQPDDLAGAPPPARGQSVPDGDDHVAVRNRGSAGHDISVEIFATITRELERAGRAREEVIETRTRSFVGHSGTVSIAIERQHRVELESEARARLPLPSGPLRRRARRRIATVADLTRKTGVRLRGPPSPGRRAIQAPYAAARER